MRNLKSFFFPAVACFAALALAGCGGGGGSTSGTQSKTTPTITWSNPAAITYGTALSSTQLNATASVAGSFVYSPVSGTVPKAGSQTLSVSFTPTDTTDYNSTTASVTLTVNKATPTITWTPAVLYVGSALSAAQLDASAGSVAGSFSYSPALGTVESTAGTVSLSTTFTPTDTTDYNNATDTASLSVVAAASAFVDFGGIYQTIRGFGGSSAWMGDLTQARITPLYGQTGTELGLSLLRVRIDPTATSSDTSPWDGERKTAQEVLATASDAKVFATPWTPPSSMKEATTQYPYNSSNPLYGGILDPAHYADYAAYLQSYVTYMANNNVPLTAISMQNEPDFNADYEACLWSASQMDTWVAAYGDTLGAPLMMPESDTFNTTLSDTALNDANAVGKISIIGGHQYGDGNTPKPYPLATSKGKELWMTEHYLTPTGSTSSSYPLPTLADGLSAAQEVHASMVTAGYNAYVWWWLFNWSSTENTGLIDSSNNPTYFGYALGQYARFIRPGYVRASITEVPITGVQMSAYEGNGHYVIVAINTNTTAAPVAFTMNQGSIGSLTSLTPYQTTASGGLQQQSAVPISGNAFTYTLPAQSITTLVQ